MNLFPVFLRDMRSPVQLRQLRKERGTGAVVATVAFSALLVADHFGDLRLGTAMRAAPAAAIASPLLLLVGLSRASTLFSVERREGTLPLLLLTHLTGFDIVLGKVLRALATEAIIIMAITPILLLPLLATGAGPTEAVMAGLGAINVLFYGLALGIFASVWADGAKAAGVCLLLFLPVMLYSSPLGFLLPRGAIRVVCTAFHWVHPLEPLARVHQAATGSGAGSYWWNLLSSHAVAWGWLGLAGWALPRVHLWQESRDLGRSRGLQSFKARLRNRSHSWVDRSRLLSVNPVLWLCQRRRWPSVKLWAVLVLSGFIWGGLAMLSLRARGLNVVYLFAIAAAVSWALAFLSVVPAEASYRLLEDRCSGALELLLCTPMDERRIIKGVWLDLRRRYLGPLLAAVSLATALAITGYVTAGFGATFDAESSRLWLFAWSAGILLLPVTVICLCWVSMRRALFAANPGEAAAIALLNLIIFPAFGLWGVGAVVGNAGFGSCLALLAVFAFSAAVRGRRARAVLLADMRQAAANRYSPQSPADTGAARRLSGK